LLLLTTFALPNLNVKWTSFICKKDWLAWNMPLIFAHKITGYPIRNIYNENQGGEQMEWVVKMNDVMNYKGVYEMDYKTIEKESFKVIGIRRTTPHGGGTWAIVKSNGSAETLKKLGGHPCDLGLCFGFGEDGSNDYMCGIEYAGEDQPGFDDYVYPGAAWLVFEAKGSISENTLGSVWSRIYGEFLPQNQYKQADLPTIEKYILWDDQSDACWVEIMIPIEK
jgi:AraC family transcriptional regulator